MLTIKQAVQHAKTYAHELFADENIKDLGLEEVTFNESENSWNVTLGFDAHRTRIIRPTLTMALQNITEEPLREYKSFQINAENGHLIGMKMRDIG